MNKLDPNIFLQKIKKANQETLESFKKHCSSNVNGNDSKLSELSLIQHCQDLQTRSDQALNIVKNCQDEINMSEPLKTLLNCEKLQVWGGFLVKNLDNFDELSVAKNGKLIMVDGFKNSSRFLEGSVRLLSLFDEVTESLSLLEGKIAAKDQKITGIVGEFFTLGMVLFFLSDLMSLTKSQVLKIVIHELASYERLKSSASDSVRGEQADIDALKAVVQAMTALKMVAVEPAVGLLKRYMEGSAECRQLLNDWVFSNVVTAAAPAKMSAAAAGNTLGGLEVCAQLVHRGVVEYDVYSMCGTYSVVQLDADTVGEIFYGDVVGSDSLRNGAVLSEKRQDVVESVARMVLQGRLVCHVEQRADDGTPTIVFGNDDNSNNSNSNNTSQPRPDAARYLAQVLDNLEKIGISK